MGNHRHRTGDKTGSIRQHQKVASSSAAHRADCPFCVGNEEDGTLETCRLGDRADWKVRAIRNKYPALSPTAEWMRISSGIHRTMAGIGIHEVIVEHPRHDLTTALLSVEEVANILLVYRQRYVEIQKKSPHLKPLLSSKITGKVPELLSNTPTRS